MNDTTTIPAPTTPEAAPTDAGSGVRRVKTLHWRREISKSDLPRGAKDEARARADHMTASGDGCMVCHDKIAGERSVTSRTVERDFRALRAAGFIMTPRWVKPGSVNGKTVIVAEQIWEQGSRAPGRGWVFECVAVIPTRRADVNVNL